MGLIPDVENRACFISIHRIACGFCVWLLYGLYRLCVTILFNYKASVFDVLNASHQHGWSRLILLIIGLACLYAITGYLGLLLAIPPGYATAVWPASGLALAGLLLFGNRLWPGVLLGSVLINLKVSFDPTTTESIIRSSCMIIGIGSGATLQALVGSYLIRHRVNLEDGLVLGRDVNWFLGLGGPVSCLISATWGVALLWFLGLLDDGEFLYSWMTWWIGDSIGVLLVVPLIFIFFGKPGIVWKFRRIRVAAPMLVTLLAIIPIFVLASHQAQSQIESEFRTRAMVFADSLEKIIEKNIEVLYSIQGLFSRSERVSHGEFQRYVQRALQRNSGIQALSWNPVISRRQRVDFERNAQSLGLSDRGIVERDASGLMVTAAEREKYVVVSYIAPLHGNRRALGYDLYSNPERRLALDQACQSGELTATNPVRLIQESGNQNGVLFFLPVYRGGQQEKLAEQQCDRLAGYVVGVFRTGDLLAEAVEAIDSIDIGVHLVDQSSQQRSRHLAYCLSGKVDQTPVFDIDDVPAFPSNFSWQKSFTIGQRSWLLKVGASNNYIANHRSWAAWMVLTGGLLFTAMLGTFLLILTGRVALDRKRAVALSAEIAQRQQIEIDLQKANESLEKLATTDYLTQIHNRRFIQDLGKKLDAETQRHDLEYTIMILDVDFFKRVNDRWSHQVGDIVLQQITQKIREQLRDSDYFGRWGGEEFIVLARNTSLQESVALAERLCDSVRAHTIDPVGQVTISIGVSGNLGRALFEKVILIADKALYSAKNKGRDRVESALPELDS